MTRGPAIVLASSSPYRREILERLGLGFDWESPEFDETPLPGESPRDLVRRLAEGKAAAVGKNHPSALVIGADQVAVLKGEVIGKPADHADAVRQLRAASGDSTTLFCGVAVLNTASGRMRTAVETVEVRCREIADAEIERYLATDRPYDCCGSLKVEGLGIALLASIRSDDPNAITGLPVIRLLELLRGEGVALP